MFEKALIALDIGSSAIKLAGLSGSGRERKVTHLAMETTPPGAFVEGKWQDTSRLLEAVARLCHQAGVKPSQTSCAISLGGPDVIIKKAWIDVPANLYDHTEIYYEASQLFQIDISEMHFRYQALPYAEKERAGKPYLLVGARRQAVDERVSLLRQLGLRTVVVDCDMFCLSNFLSFMNVPPMLAAVVNVGASHTQVVMQKGNVFLNGCELAIGGNAYTQRIMQALRCDAASAETMKIIACLGSDRVPADVHHAIDDVNEELTQQILMATQFLLQSHHSHETAPPPMQHVILTGGAARTTGLDVTVGARLQLPVALVHPFQGNYLRLKGRPSVLAAGNALLFTNAMGLALRREGDAGGDS